MFVSFLTCTKYELRSEEHIWLKYRLKNFTFKMTQGFYRLGLNLESQDDFLSHLTICYTTRTFERLMLWPPLYTKRTGLYHIYQMLKRRYISLFFYLLLCTTLSLVEKCLQQNGGFVYRKPFPDHNLKNTNP